MMKITPELRTERFLQVGSFASQALKRGADDGLLAIGGKNGSETLSSWYAGWERYYFGRRKLRDV